MVPRETRVGEADGKGFGYRKDKEERKEIRASSDTQSRYAEMSMASMVAMHHLTAIGGHGIPRPGSMAPSSRHHRVKTSSLLYHAEYIGLEKQDKAETKPPLPQDHLLNPLQILLKSVRSRPPCLWTVRSVGTASRGVNNCDRRQSLARFIPRPKSSLAPGPGAAAVPSRRRGNAQPACVPLACGCRLGPCMR